MHGCSWKSIYCDCSVQNTLPSEGHQYLAIIAPQIKEGTSASPSWECFLAHRPQNCGLFSGRVHPSVASSTLLTSFGPMWIFSQVKEKLSKCHFSSDQEAIEVYMKLINDIEKKEWKNEFFQWFLRMHKFIQTRGEYCEKMWEVLMYLFYQKILKTFAATKLFQRISEPIQKTF